MLNKEGNTHWKGKKHEIMAKLRLQRKMVEPKIQFVGRQFLDIPSIQMFLYNEDQIEEVTSEGDFAKIAGKIKDDDRFI
ncbi:MAG: hypothetical protein JG782_1403, partial [Anaerophaga sp.]|nr:hypothetical protein [Anaerophaga sp.]